MQPLLSPPDLEQYRRDGFLLVEGLLRPEEADALLDRAARYAEHPREGIHVQIEPLVEAGESQAPTRLGAVRKMEKLVAHDDLFLGFARKPAVLDRFRAILGEPVRLFRDALMWKPARVGSAKPYHQDSAYWQIEPMDLCSVWVALDDATLENGCMRVIPGSHREGLIEHRHLEDFRVPDDRIDYDREVSLEMRKGDGLFFHSLLLHATAPNLSDRSRPAMILSGMGPQARWTGKPEEEPEWLVLG